MGIMKLIALGAISASTIHAERLHIYHTNDLHSHFSGQKFERELTGGYSALKNLFDQERKKAHHKHESALFVDAGDFAEGSPYFLADGGMQSFKMMDRLGHDLVVMGNHDWLMGDHELNKILERANLKVPLLAANWQMKKKGEYPFIEKNIKPYISKKFGNVSVAILGVTTNDIYYSWRLEGIKILDPIQVVKNWVPKLRETHDVVILASHVGLEIDRKIAESVPGIDLIIGGHSHNLLTQPEWVEDPSKHLTPIVQAGSYARYFGEVEAEITREKGLEFLGYKLHPVKPAGRNVELDHLINSSFESIKEVMGKDWGEKVLATSEIPLQHNKEVPTFWGDFIAASMAEKVGTEISVHIPSLAGDDLPLGKITEMDIFYSYPRVFELKRNPVPWTIWKVKVPGALLKTLVKTVLKTGHAVHFYGLSADIRRGESQEDGAIVDDVLVQGTPVQWYKLYTVAFPEGFLRALLKVSRIGHIISGSSFDTKVTMLDALKEKLIKTGHIKLAPTESKGFLPNRGENYTMVPGN